MDASERCVAVVDVLGFRERVRAGQLTELAEQLDKLASDASGASITWAYASSDDDSSSGKESAGRLLFSDSIFLWSQPMPTDLVPRRGRVMGFVSIVAFMIGQGILRNLPLRAGLAFGPVLVEERKGIVIGQPIVDAYLAEGLQEWVGGALHPSFPEDHISSEVRYPVPTKSTGAIRLERAVDWITPAYGGTRKQKDQLLDRFRRKLVSNAETTQVEVIRQKYLNAVTFLDSLRERNDQGHA